MFNIERTIEEHSGTELHLSELQIASTQDLESLPVVPLTPRQELIWFEDELHPHMPTNNWIANVEINSPLDVKAFQAAFRAVAAAHDGAWLTVIKTSTGFSGRLRHVDAECLEYVDLSASQDPRSEYAKWMQARSSVAFSLGERLFNAAVVKLQPDLFVLYFNCHHSIADGRSFQVIVGDLDVAYRNCCADSIHGVLFEKSEPSVIEHLLEFDKYSNSDQAKASQAYWLERYSEPPEPCQFYGASGANKTPVIHRLSETLEDSTVQRIKKLRRKLPGSIIFTLISFAFLRTVTRNSDLCLGVPLHNRTRKSANIFGLYMEVCPNRLQIDSEDTFESLFKKLRAEITSVKPHKKHPVTLPNARYEVLLNYREPVDIEFIGSSKNIELISARSLLGENPTPEVVEQGWNELESLSIEIVQKPAENEIKVALNFNAGVWPDPEVRRRAHDHFLALLNAFLDDPSQRIDEVGCLAEKGSRDYEFLREMGTYAQIEDTSSLLEHWRGQLDKNGLRPALQFGEKIVSHSALNDLVLQYAAGLVAQGVAEKDHVIVVGYTSIEQTVAFLALLTIGAVYVPIDPSAPKSRIDHIIGSLKPKLLLHDSEISSSDFSHQVTCVSIGDDVFRGDARFIPARIEPQSPAYIIHTSGSTGIPKAVVVSHGALHTFAFDWAEKLQQTNEDRVLHFYSISFDAWLKGVVPMLRVGSAYVISELRGAPSCIDLFAEIQAQKISFAVVPTSYFNVMVRELAAGGLTHPGKPLRCWSFGGSALPHDIAQTALKVIPESVGLINSYGPTEAAVSVCAVNLRKSNIAENGLVPIGRPNPTVGAKIVNSAGQYAPFGVIGELWVSGPQLATEYFGQPERTKERFVTDDEDRWYQTGDLVRWSSDYQLEYSGRNDRQVQIRGHRVEPGDIEVVLRKHDAVSDVFVTSIVRAGGEHLVAYIVSRKGKSFDSQAIKNHAIELLPNYMVPMDYVSIDRIPLNTSGKIDIAALPAITFNDRSIGEAWPTSELERMIQEIWQKNFDLPVVGLDQNYSDLGGHSLLAIRMCREIEVCTGKQVSPGLFFANPTIRMLAESLRTDSDPDYSVVPLNSNTSGSPLFCFCGIFMYQHLAKAMESVCPVVGVYTKEESNYFGDPTKDVGKSRPLKMLIDRYVEAVRSVQPTGPYRLSGVSFGGIVAFEVAQSLKEAGEEVEVVALMDTIIWSATRRVWGAWMLLKAQQLAEKCFSKLKSMGRHAKSAKNRISPIGIYDDGRQTELLKQIMIRYRPEPYSGSLTLFRATEGTLIRGYEIDAKLGWRDIARDGCDVYKVRGDHLSLLHAENVVDIAATLAAKLAPGTDKASS